MQHILLSVKDWLYTPLTKNLATPRKCHIKRCFTSKIKMVISSLKFTAKEYIREMRHIQLLSFLRKYFVNQYFMGKPRPLITALTLLAREILQIWHRDVPFDSSTRRVDQSIVMLKYEWMISVAECVFFRKMFWHNYPYSLFDDPPPPPPPP